MTQTQNYKITFFRSLHSEFLKLCTQRIITVSTVLAVIFYAGICALVVKHSAADIRHFGMITDGWNIPVIFFLIMGVGAVTSEYTFNTIRTTNLADPSRTRNFLAKTLASALWALGVGIILEAVCSAVVYITAAKTAPFSSADARAFLCLLLAGIGAQLFTLGLGYLLRSTAGALALGFSLIFLLSILQIIPLKLLRETLPPFFPGNLINYAVSSAPAGQLEEIKETLQTPDCAPQTALCIFLAYVAVILVIGWVRYRRKDV